MNLTSRITGLVWILTLASGCWVATRGGSGTSTPYQWYDPSCDTSNCGSTKSKGGYRDSQLQADTFQVSFSANAHTSMSKAERYLLYRCAELSTEHGFDHFVVFKRGDESTVNVAVEARVWGVNTQTSTFPGLNMLIRAGRGPKPAEGEAYDAAELMAALESKLSALRSRGKRRREALAAAKEAEQTVETGDADDSLEPKKSAEAETPAP